MPSKSGWVYVLRGDDIYKIGMTRDQPIIRLKQVTNRMVTYSELELVILIRSLTAAHLEELMHRRFQSQCVGGEYFNLTEENLAYMKRMTGFDQEATNSTAEVLQIFNNRKRRPDAWKHFKAKRRALLYAQVKREQEEKIKLLSQQRELHH